MGARKTQAYIARKAITFNGRRYAPGDVIQPPPDLLADSGKTTVKQNVKVRLSTRGVAFVVDEFGQRWKITGWPQSNGRAEAVLVREPQSLDALVERGLAERGPAPT